MVTFPVNTVHWTLSRLAVDMKLDTNTDTLADVEEAVLKILIICVLYFCITCLILTCNNDSTLFDSQNKTKYPM